MNRSIVVAWVMSAVLAAPSLAAQTLPRYAVELTGGAGARSSQAGSVWYAGTRDNLVRGALSVRLGSPGRIRPVLNADYGFSLRGDQVAICGVAPNGSCIQYFPGVDGFTAGVGVRAMAHSRIALGSSIGLASVGRRGRYADVDVAITLARRLSAVVHWRRLDWSSANGNLWFQPLSVGLRMRSSAP